MTTSTTLHLADDLTISRMGYGAMQLAGRGAFGPPRDHDEAVAVLREAVARGVTHIDTSDYYGPVVVNRLVREALHPYPENLVIATKVGSRRMPDGAWIQSLHPEDLKAQVYDNLRNLGVDALDLVNLRVGGVEETRDDPLAEPFGALAELREQGLIRHLGLSGVTVGQLREAQSIAPVVAVQNLYNLVKRVDDPLVDVVAAEGIAFVGFFPLGGFSPLQSTTLSAVAERLGASPQQVALAWLLQRSKTMAVIPGTSSVAHLRENLAAADLVLPADAVAELDGIAG
ncbi:Predicted oxidoreductase [Asanoa hainanensis]|uniref:Predicted oxidoreductase n=1 Tax=Asanoa hainanensis TaxID=560556 RepID=A0A239P5M8_9ACTN|nr:oxidoreductase [Asanoa hainanensis]SNT62425.1 Predicted oxidoreductase [Asanoa hainanensis]